MVFDNILVPRQLAGTAERPRIAAGGHASEGDGVSMGEGIRGPAAGPQAVTRICAMTSPYAVSPTGVKPTRWKKCSGPPSPAS